MSDPSVNAPALDDVRAAAGRLAPYIVRSPLLPLHFDADRQPVHLKLENLQPVGAFKVRPMGNAMLCADPDALRNGVYTASSGNAGLALAWMARQLGIPATVYAPENAPKAKLDAVRRFEANVRLISEPEWWQIILERGHPSEPGYFVDAVRNPSAMAGIGTIALEIAEQLPDVDTVIVPIGGGGAACGIASAMSALKPGVRVIAAESEAAAPVTAAFRDGRPVQVPVEPSFISGVGAPTVLEEMWPLIRQLVHGTAVVPVAEVAEAVRLLFLNNRVVAEGAGALPVAAAQGGAARGTTVCVVTGGNIDHGLLGRIIDRQPL